MRTHSDVLCKRLDELAAVVAAGPPAIAREFTMCIPANPDRDADIVLSDAAQRIRELESINAGLYKALRAYMLLAGTPTPIEDMGKAALAKVRGEN